MLFRARFRSNYEARLCYEIQSSGHNLDEFYERQRIPYVVPARTAQYLPDLMSRDGRLVIEIKGRFRDVAERQKYLDFQRSNPEIEVRFVIQRAGVPIYKKSKTTQEAWLTKHGFKVAIGTIPKDWVAELTR